jgi:hypothetical protein
MIRRSWYRRAATPGQPRPSPGPSSALIGVVLVLGIATGLVTACSAAKVQEEGGAGGSTPSGEGDAQGDQDISQPGVDRALVRTATIELTGADVGGTVVRARDIAVTRGGYAGQEAVREESGTLTLHIPSDRFDQALGELAKLGKVISRNQTAEDVTEQMVDLDSRIATQRASVDRVRALLAMANTVDEIVRIEQEVTTREADLESLEQRRQALAGQVAMSTVTINVSTDAAAASREDESSGFLAGLSGGWGAFVEVGAVTLQVLGALLPFLLLLAVPAALAIRWWRRRRTTATQVQHP